MAEKFRTGYLQRDLREGALQAVIFAIWQANQAVRRFAKIDSDAAENEPDAVASCLTTFGNERRIGDLGHTRSRSATS